MKVLSVVIGLLWGTAFAAVGEVVKSIGDNDARVLRGGNTLPAEVGTELEVGDEVRSNGSHLVLFIHPASQLSLPKGAAIRITEASAEEGKDLVRSKSMLELLKEMVRVKVTREGSDEAELSVTAPNVAFAVRGTEFEVALSGDEVELDVVEGEVEFSSPLVQTFVPEIIKASEGFRFDRRKKEFGRRKLIQRLKNRHGFVDRERLRELRQRRMKQGIRRKKGKEFVERLRKRTKR